LARGDASDPFAREYRPAGDVGFYRPASCTLASITREQTRRLPHDSGVHERAGRRLTDPPRDVLGPEIDGRVLPYPDPQKLRFSPGGFGRCVAAPAAVGD
jgi:hypothetical protein